MVIYPSQAIRLRNFFERFLEEYYKALPGTRDISPECPTVKRIVEEAEKLRDMLVVEAAQPQREVGKAYVFSEIS
jgi:hypothetical protein